MSSIKTAVVTGVSTGIGRATAATLIRSGWHVFGSVRKASDAADAGAALGKAFTPLVFDVTDADAIAAAAVTVDTALSGRTLNALVNNAGISAAGPMRYVAIDELKTVFDVNVYGVVRVTQAFLPMLGADHGRPGTPGRIVNISSLSGRISVPFMGPYSMSKFAVEALSDALRVELRPHGIDVVVLEPGPVRTPIFEKTETADFSAYAASEYAEQLQRLVASSKALGAHGLEPDEIGRLILRILNDRAPRARYPVLKNRFSRWTMPSLLPTRVLDRALARRSGLTARAEA